MVSLPWWGQRCSGPDGGGGHARRMEHQAKGDYPGLDLRRQRFYRWVRRGSAALLIAGAIGALEARASGGGDSVDGANFHRAVFEPYARVEPRRMHGFASKLAVSELNVIARLLHSNNGRPDISSELALSGIFCVAEGGVGGPPKGLCGQPQRDSGGRKNDREKSDDALGVLFEKMPNAMLAHPERNGDAGWILIWGCLCSLVLSTLYAIVKRIG